VAQSQILVILGHPSSDSLCGAIARRYAEGSGAEVLVLGSLNFDALADPRRVADLEPDLLRAQERILGARHLVFVYPLWWGSVPALFKGFIDRTFTSGFAFRYHDGKLMPERLLSGRTARIIMTMDSPRWWHRLVYRQSGTSWLKWATLWFSGVDVTGVNTFTPIRMSTQAQREAVLNRAAALGMRDSSR
jgi:putative NADPH-quinone reductase